MFSNDFRLLQESKIICKQLYIVNYVFDDKKDTTWITDKRGVKVNELIIKPIMMYVDQLMIEYIDDINDMIKKDDVDYDMCASEIKSSYEIREKVRNIITHHKLIKSITPHFYFALK